MNLLRTTVCQLFELRQPIWNGGHKVAGLNVQRLGAHNEIHFLYRRKSDGELSIPDAYYISRDKINANNYPTMVIKGTTLVLVPFYDLEILHRVDDPKTEPVVGLLNEPLRRDDKRWHKHTTHYACRERMELFGGQTIGCCCTGHECKKELAPAQEAML